MKVLTHLKQDLNYFIDYECVFEVGDGIGGPEEYIGVKQTEQSCIDACVARKLLDPQINGVAIQPSGSGKCYCEKNMERSNGSPSWKTCQLKLKDSEKKNLYIILFCVYSLHIFLFANAKNKM